MKYLENISVGIIVSCVLSGCSVMETDFIEPNEEGGVALAVNDIGVSTKSIYTGIGTGSTELQQVGVVVTNAADGAYYDAEHPMQLFYYDKSAWGMKKDTLYLMKEKDGKVYACSLPTGQGAYPVTLTDGKPAITGTVSQSQTCTPPANDTDPLTDVSQYDYLYGVASGETTGGQAVTHKNNTVSLEMRHFLAKVSFRFMKAQGQQAPNAGDYVKKVILKSESPVLLAGGDYSFSLADGTVTGTSSLTAEITFSTKNAGDIKQVDAYAADHAGLAAKMFGLVAPVTGVSGTISVLLGAKGNETYDRTYEVQAETFTWASGNHYIYTLKVTDAGLTVGKPAVVGWNETTHTWPIQPDGVTPN